MANYNTDATMGLLIPIPGVDPGEEYAVLISDDLNKIASHTHTGASNSDGNKIPTAGLNINADISVQSNNITNSRSIRFIDQSSSLIGPGDLDCIYFENGNLWINNGSATPIQITSGNLVNVTSTNNYKVLDISTNHTINSSDTDILFSCNTIIGNVIITLPLASSVPIGRFYIVKDTSGTSETHSITVNANSTDTIDSISNYIITDNHHAAIFVKDTSTSWMLFTYDKKIYNENAIIKFNNTGMIEFVSTGTVKFDGAGNILFNNGSSQITMSQGGTIDLQQAGFINLSTSGQITNPGLSQLTGMLAIGKQIVATTPFNIQNVPSAGATTTILVNTSTIAITLNLPSVINAPPGTVYIIKDYVGNASNKNITVIPQSTEKIEGVTFPKIINTDNGGLTLLSMYPLSNNWIMI